MLFNEVYGSYFNVVAAVLTEALEGRLTNARLNDIINEKAFSESSATIFSSITNADWPLLDHDLRPVIAHKPTMPLTTLQKRWLKSLLSDPRIVLFEPDTTGLEDVEPLYRRGTFVMFDRYGDGDPYDDPEYVTNFRTVLRAVRERRMLRVCFLSRNGARCFRECVPYRIEYSSKDDKFRLIAVGGQRLTVINMARICSCELLGEFDPGTLTLPREQQEELILLLRDERNALERAALHFSHFEKEIQKFEEGLYQIKLRYDKEDETELLIRVLSFGPVLRVISPDRFIRLVKERIQMQLDHIALPC